MTDYTAVANALKAEGFIPNPTAILLLSHLDLPTAAEYEGAKWEHFQIEHLTDTGMFRIENKSRQIAWSFIAAAEALVNAVFFNKSSLFQSINLEEATEKIRYAKAVYENMNGVQMPALVRDSTQRLEFDNGARIISSAGTPQRGKRVHTVYLDEWAHQQHDNANYKAALPMISKGGKLRGASSPLGGGGLFWEIFTESMRTYPGFTRKETPWWEIKAFCTDVFKAKYSAGMMLTNERVNLYGNERIKSIFENMLLEDFQAEYECSFIDESSAWITWAEIKSIQDNTLTCYQVECRDSNVGNALNTIQQMKKDSTLERVYTAGVDVGRTRNATEIFLVGTTSTKSRPLRLMITLSNCDFDSQLDVLLAVVNQLPVTKMLIDHNGIGRNLAESLEKRMPVKCEGVTFTNATKQLWATDAKMLTQQGKVLIPNDRDLAYQIHSIKRMVTAAKNMVFDTERNEKHHADKFWAWCLALYAGKGQITAPIVLGNMKKKSLWS